ncbi:phosphate acyltransferase PlsX [Athalassotoga saccharophila]|uniref:phosphate acyltransferase PlsX n=1 Tax=Athalassotoga saccharophila TaxID=1441386 RepID=UPI00137B3395|nr:phosphate acyltransferase PlsX [Athalassotoga saccharophila]BBJ28502.1 phosphate acyltransferase [Athalassotoga saccharophila]
MAHIALDAFGGDHAPYEEVKGALLFVEKTGHKVTLVGDEKKISPLIPKDSKIEIVNAPERFGMSAKPTEILKRKEASMNVAAMLVKEGKAEGFVSAGNTGALLVLGTFLLGRMEGIERPAIATVMPSKSGGTVLIDAGANLSLKPPHYVQLGIMGVAYAKGILNKKNPKVGLLNVGAEEEKGPDLLKEVYSLLKDKFGETFCGNVEGRDVFYGDVDVVLSDGFSGNIVLKTSEGVGLFVSEMLKRSIKNSNVIQKIGALLMKGTFDKFKESLDYRKYGGAFLLGVNGIVVKAHGASDSKAIFNALNVAATGIDKKIIDTIRGSV